MKDITELIKELKHKDSSVRRNAAETLGKIGGARLVEPLIEALKEEKDEFVKESIKKF
jgi:HEAT repeat protein